MSCSTKFLWVVELLLPDSYNLTIQFLQKNAAQKCILDNGHRFKAISQKLKNGIKLYKHKNDLPGKKAIEMNTNNPYLASKIKILERFEQPRTPKNNRGPRAVGRP